MSKFLFFLIIYAIFLAGGLIFAFWYRRFRHQKELNNFKEFIKMRSYLYSQINALMKAYNDFLKLRHVQIGESKFNLGETATLFKDVETNLVILKTELTSLNLPGELVRAKEEMLKIVKNLSNHIFSILSTKNLSDLLQVLKEEPLKDQKKGFKIVNKVLKEFIKLKGLKEEEYFSEEKWLYL